MPADTMITLERGKPYPLPCLNREGAAANFLGDSGNILQICLPGMTHSEEMVYRKKPVRAGVIVRLPVILLLFDYGGMDVLDCPYDIHLVPRDHIRLPDITNNRQRLMIESHIVDTESGLLRGLRSFTLSSKVTIAFLLAVQEQMARIPNPAEYKRVLDRLYARDNRSLTALCEMDPCGV